MCLRLSGAGAEGAEDDWSDFDTASESESESEDDVAQAEAETEAGTVEASGTAADAPTAGIAGTRTAAARRMSIDPTLVFYRAV
eukprot:SAG11_NODE_16992_length_531_cov_1.888889_1_plen_83_part_10